jgi:uncharacterized membrane protein YtjA (UPF0391 family)
MPKSSSKADLNPPSRIWARLVSGTRLASTFLLLAMGAAVFGFTGLPGAATATAQVLFFVFLVLLVVSDVVQSLSERAAGLNAPPPEDRKELEELFRRAAARQEAECSEESSRRERCAIVSRDAAA